LANTSFPKIASLARAVVRFLIDLLYLFHHGALPENEEETGQTGEVMRGQPPLFQNSGSAPGDFDVKESHYHVLLKVGCGNGCGVK